jgi:hypothetical protein
MRLFSLFRIYVVYIGLATVLSQIAAALPEYVQAALKELLEDYWESTMLFLEKI